MCCSLWQIGSAFVRVKQQVVDFSTQFKWRSNPEYCVGGVYCADGRIWLRHAIMYVIVSTASICKHIMNVT
jgi:hypothetical protein